MYVTYFNKTTLVFNLMITGLIKIHLKFLIITPHVHGYSNNEQIIAQGEQKHFLYQRINH